MKTNCDVIRRELDEVMLGDNCSAVALSHLRECSDCQEFNQKQTKLRQIVGSLGTVRAPADFDFRLRARLANEAGTGAYPLKAAHWPFARRALTLASAVVLFFGVFVGARYFMRQPMAVDSKVVISELPQSQPAATLSARTEATQLIPHVVAMESVTVRPQPRDVIAPGSIRRKKATVAADFSSVRAPIIKGEQSIASTEASDIFSIDASTQSLRVSLDDGHGNLRTISLPAVSFGSQRRLISGNQLAPKSIW
jgi:hypothetical protein